MINTRNEVTEKIKLHEKPVNVDIRSGEIISKETSYLSSANLNLFLTQLSVQPMLPREPAGKHRYQNHFRPASVSINREAQERREYPQLLQSAICLDRHHY